MGLTREKLSCGITIVLAALAGFGCGSVSDADALSITEDQKRSSIERLGQNAPEAQSEAFSDGTISVEEHSVAVLASYDCFEDGLTGEANVLGVEVTVEPPARTGDRFEWSYQIAASSEEQAAAAEVVINSLENECRRTYESSIVEAFRVQLIPTGSERRELLNQLSACVEANGVDLPDNFTLASMELIDDEDLSQFASCASEHPRLFYTIR